MNVRFLCLLKKKMVVSQQKFSLLKEEKKYILRAIPFQLTEVFHYEHKFLATIQLVML